MLVFFLKIYRYYNQREEEYEAKVDELLTRLQEQTTAARKLQDELDSYEWYEEEEEENTGTVKTNDSGDTGAVPKANHPSRPPSSRSHHGSHSRPSSTRYAKTLSYFLEYHCNILKNYYIVF